MIAIDNSRVECWQQNLLCAPEIWNYQVHLCTKCSWCPWVTLLACVIFRFYSGISLKRFQENKKPWCSPWTHEPINVVVRRVGFEQSDQCVIVCAQNVSGMVSRVEGTRYRCPWGQSPPAALPLSQNQTSALAAIPFSRILSSQDRFGAARGRTRRGVQPVVREERRTRGQRLLPTGDWRTGRVWRETFGSNKSIRALFSWVRVSLSESGSAAAATVSLGWVAGSVQTLASSMRSSFEVHSPQKSCHCKFWRFI